MSRSGQSSRSTSSYSGKIPLSCQTGLYLPPHHPTIPNQTSQIPNNAPPTTPPDTIHGTPSQDTPPQHSATRDPEDPPASPQAAYPADHPSRRRCLSPSAEAPLRETRGKDPRHMTNATIPIASSTPASRRRSLFRARRRIGTRGTTRIRLTTDSHGAVSESECWHSFLS